MDSIVITGRKKIYFNRSKYIDCFHCGIDLHDKYILSAPKQRYRCLDCAVKINMIEEIPEQCQ